jgi:hypothetical protein
MKANDENICDEAYAEEYDGIASLPTWEIITESQSKQLSKDIMALPSMAIATTKYDVFNHPKHAKYLLFVLGNLVDYHDWSKASIAAPVYVST